MFNKIKIKNYINFLFFIKICIFDINKKINLFNDIHNIKNYIFYIYNYMNLNFNKKIINNKNNKNIKIIINNEINNKILEFYINKISFYLYNK